MDEKQILVRERSIEEFIDKVERGLIKETKADDMATLAAYFDSQGWNWDIARFGKMITSPEYDGKYYYFPKSMDKTILTQEGLQRLKAVEELGIEIQGVIIGHEIKKPEKNRLVEVDWVELGQRAREAAKTAAIASVAIIGTLAVATLVGFANIVMMSLTTLDPMIIIVLDDEANTNVEIYWWDVPSGE